MSAILELQDALLKASELIHELEAAVASDPLETSLAMNLRFMLKRRQDLETQFAAIADSAGLEICRYRLFGFNAPVAVKSLTSVLNSFQNALSLVYDAVRTGNPRMGSRLAESSIQESSLAFGYTYAGSIGIVLTVPNERRLFGESHLDEAMRTFTELTKASTPPEVSQFAKYLGVAPIHAIYNWASSHVEAGLGAEIEWRRQQSVLSRIFVQAPELQGLRNLIASAGDEETIQFTVEGQLLGADVARHSFHMEVGGENITGDFIDAISIEHTAILPKTYRATIRRTTRIKYSTEQIERSDRLLHLEQV